MASLEAVATALRTANRACFIIDCKQARVSRTISALQIIRSFARDVWIVPGATMLTVTRLPKILRSTTDSITMGITISPLGVSSTAGSVRKEVTSVEAEMGLWAHARRPTNTRVRVASFCRCDCCTRAWIELLSLESMSIVRESQKFANSAIGAASSSFGDRAIGRARLRAADSSSDEPFERDVSPCLRTNDGMTVQTSSVATLGEINLGSTSDESLRGS